ncbi:hypothetical protein F2Q69_00042651 [Brassica cretica]|uniref:Uncharacterized protein n=1 Tax=Brassica cretica TaxID=69181 RepID=A0A8S9N5V0_BRACR|nr:hypothetical protein F2Q69_00042651 [Brassica cretica]
MKWVRYGLRETASKGRRECMDLSRIDVSEELGRYWKYVIRPDGGALWKSMIALDKALNHGLGQFRKWMSLAIGRTDQSQVSHDLDLWIGF